VLLLFGIVILLAMVLNPLVVYLERRRVPRPAGVALVLIALAAIVVLVVAVAVPTFTDQVQLLIQRAPGAWQSIRGHIADFTERYPALQNTLPQADQIAATVGNQAGTMANVLLRSTIGVVGGLFIFVFAVLLLIFVLSNPRPLIVGYLAVIPDRHREKARRTLIRMMEQMTAWARGVAINGVITGASTGILLWAVGVQPAFVFGVLAFFGEFLPNIGPVLVAFPVLFVALSISVTKFWLALGAILFVQQVEVNFLVPYILGKEMRLNPVLILFFTVAMGWLFGLAGAILALPAAALTKIVIEEFYLRPREVDYAPLERDADRIVRTESAHDTLPL
jgi:predicted PurR-regulated permease PerM